MWTQKFARRSISVQVMADGAPGRHGQLAAPPATMAKDSAPLGEGF